MCMWNSQRAYQAPSQCAITSHMSAKKGKAAEGQGRGVGSSIGHRLRGARLQKISSIQGTWHLLHQHEGARVTELCNKAVMLFLTPDQSTAHEDMFPKAAANLGVGEEGSS